METSVRIMKQRRRAALARDGEMSLREDDYADVLVSDPRKFKYSCEDECVRVVTNFHPKIQQ